MPLWTSDYQRLTICMSQEQHAKVNSTNQFKRCTASTSATPGETTADDLQLASKSHRNCESDVQIEPLTELPNNRCVQKEHSTSTNVNDCNHNNCNNSADITSMNSSDTYASCQTHPFLSQGDLTSEVVNMSSTLDGFDVKDAYFATLDSNQPSLALFRSQVRDERIWRCIIA